MSGDALFVLARVLHVISIVLWIGGVAFLALVVVPTLRQRPKEDESLAILFAIEGRFKAQAKIVTAITGLSGFFMLYWLDAWDRYLDLSYWWVHLMTLIWLFFSAMLFAVEPAQEKHDLEQKTNRNPAVTFKFLNRMLNILTFLSVLAIAGAINGVHG